MADFPIKEVNGGFQLMKTNGPEQETKPEVRLLDCTARDGGYVLGWNQPPQYIRDLFKVAEEAGVEYVEIGFINQRHETSGWWDAIRLATVHAIEHNKSEPQTVVMLDYGKWPHEDMRWISQVIDVIRIACRYEDVEGAMMFGGELHRDYGVRVSINVMQLSNLPREAAIHLTQLGRRYNPWAIYLADTFGACFPQKVSQIINFMRLNLPETVQIGFHGHDNMQLAFANSLAAAEAGATLIDCSVLGLGRGGGNLSMEMAVGHWRGLNKIRPMNEFYEKWLKGSIDTWGPSFEDVATGMMNCHPNYAEMDVPLHTLIHRLSTMNDADRAKFNKFLFTKDEDD